MNRPKLRIVVSLVALALAAQTAWGANLGDIYKMAQDNDAQYAAAQEAYKAGLEKEHQGRAGLLPVVSLSANVRQNETDSSLLGSSSYGSQGYAVSLVQPLYRKQNLEAYEQAKLLSLLAEQQLKTAEQSLLLSVAQTYFDLLTAQDAVATAQAQKAAFAEQLAQARKSFEVGVSTITDVYESQASYDQTTAQEISALNDLEVKRRTLEKIISREAPKLAVLSPQAGMPTPVPNDMAVWVKQAEEHNLSVVQNQTSVEIASREVARQRGGHHPTLDLSVSYSDARGRSTTGDTQTGGTQTGGTQTGVIGLELGWSLYQGGATSSRVREAMANLEKARHDLDYARRQATLDVRKNFFGVISDDALVKALQQALISSESQFKATKLGLEVGVRTRVDVLNAEQQIFTTQRDLSAARYKTLLAGLQLKAAAGSLSEADLKAVDALLK